MNRALLLALSACIFINLFCGGAKAPDPGETARMYGSRAATLFTEGNLLGAVAEYGKAYAAAARADLPIEEAQCLFNSGRVWYELDRLDSAAVFFETAYRDFTYYHADEKAAVAAGFIALVNSRLGNGDSAYAWYTRGRPANLDDNAQTAFWLSIQARLCIAKNRIPEAQGYIDRAFECAQKEKMFSAMAQLDYMRAEISYRASHYDEARSSLVSSIALLDKAPERYRRWQVLLAASAVSFCLRDEEAGIRYHTRAIDCAPKGMAVVPIDSVRTCPGWVGK
jgi:tetratricopeptide (TPR) repeat protein